MVVKDYTGIPLTWQVFSCVTPAKCERNEDIHLRYKQVERKAPKSVGSLHVQTGFAGHGGDDGLRIVRTAAWRASGRMLQHNLRILLSGPLAHIRGGPNRARFAHGSVDPQGIAAGSKFF